MSDCNALELNNLQRNNFKISIARIPGLQFRAQRVKIPDIVLGQAERPTPFVTLYEPGNIQQEPMTFEFLVSESMQEYVALVNWMNSLGAPDQFDSPREPELRKSDITVSILNSSLKESMGVVFTNSYPIYLSGLDFDITLREAAYHTATVTFRYDRYYYRPVTS